MIKIYTDASLSETFAVVSCMVFSDSQFLGYNNWKFSNITKSYQAEILGICEGIKYAQELRKDPHEQLFVYTDSKAALSSILGTHLPKLKRARDAVFEIKSLCAKETITLLHIKGHQTDVNPNTVVDNMARHVMRSNRRTACEE